jgi:alanine dehydrogenase
MLSESSAIKNLIEKGSLLVQEEKLEVKGKRKSLSLGIPKETSFQEHRVALSPEAVSFLVANGHEVKIETGAGELANFADTDYSEVGAQICYDTKEVFSCHHIIKVAPPSNEEIELMPGNQVLISALQISVHPKVTLEALMKKKITAIAWDYIKDDAGIFPIVRAMGEIAGNCSVLIAAELLSNINSGKGLMLGGVPGVAPLEVVVLGAGTVGEYASKAAMGLGASVKVFDNNISKLRRLQNDLSTRLWTSAIQPKLLEKAIKRADVVIGAVRAPLGRTPCVVTDGMVAGMKEGSVIVDISIDQGGCFETSKITNHDNPTYTVHGVVHYCVPNVASRVSRTATLALSNIFSPMLLEMGEKGGCTELIKRHCGFRSGVYLYNGILTSEILGKVFGIPYKDIDLLLPAM